MHSRFAAFAVLSCLLAGTHVCAAPALSGDVAARIAVTMDPDSTGTIHVPSPFSIVPGTSDIMLVVPESDGAFLLRGDRILHHFPLPISRVHDLEVSSELLVTGRRPEVGHTTVDLEIIDFPSRRRLDRVQSANPFLRIQGPGYELWRVVLEGDRVGIYDPSRGASYPLWVRGEGRVLSSDQIALASPGIGWNGALAWMPLSDGTVSRTHRGRSELFTSGDEGEFLEAVTEDSALLLAPTRSVRVDSDGEYLLDRELAIRWRRLDGATRDFRIETTSSDMHAKRIVMRGRMVRVRDAALYWIFAGYDYLEIRTLPLSEILGPDVGLGSH